MKIIDKILGVLEVTVSNIFFIAMCTLVILQILLRTFGLPLSWTEEIARYLFVWVVYLSTSRALAKGSHLSVDIVVMFLKGRVAAVMALFVDVVLAFFVGFVVINGFELIREMTVTPQYSAAVGINMIIPYSAPVVGCIMMGIRIIEKCIHDIKWLINPDFMADGGGKEELA